MLYRTTPSKLSYVQPESLKLKYMLPKIKTHWRFNYSKVGNSKNTRFGAHHINTSYTAPNGHQQNCNIPSWRFHASCAQPLRELHMLRRVTQHTGIQNLSCWSQYHSGKAVLKISVYVKWSTHLPYERQST